MIGTLMRISWLNLKRDRLALGLTFILPIVFFSIFAFIFGGVSLGAGGGGGGRPVIVVDEDNTETSERFIKAVDGLEALRVVRKPQATEENPNPDNHDRESASLSVRQGDYSVALVILSGFADTFGSFGVTEDQIELIYDQANPVAKHTVGGLLQAAAMSAAPDLLMDRGVDYLTQYGGALTPDQQNAVDTIKPFLSGERSWDERDEEPGQTGDADGTNDSTSADNSGPFGSGSQGLVRVKSTDVRGDEYDYVAYYAAGIGVMFLLFSMAGAGGSILEEEETGTLERLLSSSVGMGRLIISNWLFYAIIGVMQVSLMFLWGAFIFNLSLWTPRHLVGCAIMTIVTGGAAAAFGIVLATLCKSRAQLGGMSTIIILIMSALGGSMVPRFIMPAFMNTTAKFTFNGWALDGYLKVFWYDDPNHTLIQSIISLWPQLAMLVGMTIVFLIAARLLARRWETA